MLKRLLKTPWPSSETQQNQILSRIASCRRASAKVDAVTILEVMKVFTEDGIDFVVAPFEADWQLAYMYNNGIINAIDTTDSDHWALIDDPCLLLNVNVSDLKAHVCFGNNCMLRGQELSTQSKGSNLPEPIHGVSRVGAIIRAAVYGNDYHEGISNVGAKTLEPLFTEYKDDINGLVKHLTSAYPSFTLAYEMLTNIYHHAPVFEMQLTQSKQHTTFLGYSFTERIISLEGLVADRDDICFWPNKIGFDPRCSLYDNYRGTAEEFPSMLDIAEGRWFASEGKASEDFSICRDKNSNGEELPFGSMLNFVTCPPCYQPTCDLMRWLSVRGYQRRKRHNLLKVVNRMCKQEGIEIMTEEDSRILLPKCIRYSGLEVLLPSITDCVWETKDLTILRRVQGSNKYITRIFGKRNGVRLRALQRLRNGHFYIDTLRSTKVSSRVKYGKPTKKLNVVQCECLASMKSDVYRVTIVVNEKGAYIKAPYSRCSCAAGNMFCAHMLGLIMVCQIAKMNPSWSRTDMAECLPSHTEQLQRLPVPVSNLWRFTGNK